ncbi:hypothetical protein ACLOJK_029487 [Asimina triloba]
MGCIYEHRSRRPVCLVSFLRKFSRGPCLVVDAKALYKGVTSLSSFAGCCRWSYKVEKGHSYLNPINFRCLPSFPLILSFVAKMLEKQPITLEDLDVIREGYSIPSSIVLSASAVHETSRDHCPGHLYLNECMLGARVRIPFDFRVAEALCAFNVSPARIVPHS